MALFLCLSFTYSVAAQGVWITEEELATLEAALTTAQSELKISQAELSKLNEMLARQETRLDGLASLASEQVKQSTELSGLFERYENAARLERTALIVALVATSLAACGLGVAYAIK